MWKHGSESDNFSEKSTSRNFIKTSYPANLFMDIFNKQQCLMFANVFLTREERLLMKISENTEKLRIWTIKGIAVKFFNWKYILKKYEHTFNSKEELKWRIWWEIRRNETKILLTTRGLKFPTITQKKRRNKSKRLLSAI